MKIRENPTGAFKILQNLKSQPKANFSSSKILQWQEKLTLFSGKILRWLAWRSKQAASIPSQLAWRVSKIAFIEKSILYPKYQKALKAHESQLPIIDSIGTKIVDELERNGSCITSLAELAIPNTHEFWASAKKLAQELKENSLLPENKDKYEILATSEQILKHAKLFPWGLNERLLNIIEKYVGLPLAYDGCLFVSSIPDGREIGARAWHRDRECRKMVKVCVYLNDVVEEGGPFQCIKPELNSLMCSTIKQRYQSIFNQELKRFQPNPSEAVKTFTAKAGTVIFFDPASYYHRGKPPTRFHRSAIFFSYFSRRPWHPFFCQRSPFSKKQLNLLTVDASQHQRDCTYWKDTLPWFVRLIPRSRI